MTSLASLAEVRLMFAAEIAGVVRRLYVYSIPLLNTICYPIRVRLFIQVRSTWGIASLAALAVYSGVVSLLLIHPYGNGDLLARPPSTVALVIVASESPHHVCVIRFDTWLVVVNIVEFELEAVFFEKSRYIGM